MDRRKLVKVASGNVDADKKTLIGLIDLCLAEYNIQRANWQVSGKLEDFQAAVVALKDREQLLSQLERYYED